MELGQRSRNDAGGGRGEGAEPDPSGRTRAHGIEFHRCRRQRVADALFGVQEDFAGRRGAHGPAFEHSEAGAAFEFGDLLGDRGRAVAELACGGVEGAVAHDGFEGGEQAGVESVHGVKAHLSVAKMCFLVITDERQQDSCSQQEKRKPAPPGSEHRSPRPRGARPPAPRPPSATARRGRRPSGGAGGDPAVDDHPSCPGRKWYAPSTTHRTHHLPGRRPVGRVGPARRTGALRLRRLPPGGGRPRRSAAAGRAGGRGRCGRASGRDRPDGRRGPGSRPVRCTAPPEHGAAGPPARPVGTRRAGRRPRPRHTRAGSVPGNAADERARGRHPHPAPARQCGPSRPQPQPGPLRRPCRHHRAGYADRRPPPGDPAGRHTPSSGGGPPRGGFVVAARAADGTVEAIESTRHRFAVGVQWHPEMGGAAPVVHALVAAAGSAASAEPAPVAGRTVPSVRSSPGRTFPTQVS